MRQITWDGQEVRRKRLSLSPSFHVKELCREKPVEVLFENPYMSSVRKSVFDEGREMKASRQWPFDSEERLIYHEQSLMECLPSATHPCSNFRTVMMAKNEGMACERRLQSLPTSYSNPQSRLSSYLRLFRKRSIN